MFSPPRAVDNFLIISPAFGGGEYNFIYSLNPPPAEGDLYKNEAVPAFGKGQLL